MAKKRKQSTFGVVTAIVVAIVVWFLKNKTTLFDDSSLASSDGTAAVDSAGNVSFDTAGLTEFQQKTGVYTLLENCELVDYRNNDGDSFMVRHSKGKDEVRLYYVDTAESRLHRHNGKRIADQGAYFGGLSQQQTTELGVEGKKLTLGLLKGEKFSVATKREAVYDSERIYVFVLIEKNGKRYYLHEILARSGLVRTETRGAPLPDGTSFYKQRDKVRALEAQAKKAKRGAWGVLSTSK